MRLPPAEAEAEGPNLTPVIDVVFLLLIFFLVATRFTEEEREIATRLPDVAKASPVSMPPNEVIVNVTKEGEYVVVGETMTEESLKSLLEKLAFKNPGTQKVQIRVDERAPFRYPARVMGLCEREDIEHYCAVLEER